MFLEYLAHLRWSILDRVNHDIGSSMYFSMAKNIPAADHPAGHDQP
jgi:hypothetical protein